MKSGRLSGAAYFVAVALSLSGHPPAHAAPRSDLHYAPNYRFEPGDEYLPRKAGFNLADLDSVRRLAALPAGVKGLVWVGQCRGVDATFLRTVRPFVGQPKLFGFYLMDDADPTGKHKRRCSPDNLKAESDWVHANARGAKTFIVPINLSSSKTPSYMNTYNPANSHIDLFGIDPYPCRTELNGCDYGMIDRYVTAAEDAGIPRDRIVPVYQAFGGGNWRDGGGGQYALPSAEEEQEILRRWGALVPTPVFDFAYSWGSQNADMALASAPDLRAVFARHNAAAP